MPSDSILQRTGRAHLIGIGGCGMKSLAAVLRSRGWTVTGSDLRVSPHAAENVPADIDLVVYSDAVGPENCERVRATQLGLLQFSYPQMLGQLMCEGVGLAVAGTHGKSTTTAMAAHVLNSAGLLPTVICGARSLQEPNTPTAFPETQDEPLVLVEACEYRENFLHLRPQTTVLLGIEPDHFDYYQNQEQLLSAFARFAEKTCSGGTLLVNAHCSNTLAISDLAGRRRETFGIEIDAHWQAVDLHCLGGSYRFRLVYHGRSLGVVHLGMLGRHNVLNALAAAALAREVGAHDEVIVSALSEFPGIERRLERGGTLGSATWIDDYAHHPTEVAAALHSVREMSPEGRIWCVFQPHQQSRTQVLLDEFAQSLQNADNVLIADIYQAREKRQSVSGVSASDLADRTRALGVAVDPRHCPHHIADRVREAIREGELRTGDVLLTMGAGDIGAIVKAELIPEGADSAFVPAVPSDLTSTTSTTLQV